jgi:hypothetical protein
MDPLEHYQPPRSDVSPGEGPPLANPKLYSIRQIAAATFVGTPLAGAILMGANYRALGQHTHRRNTLIAGVVATAVVFALAFMLPERFPNFVLPLAYVLGIQAAATQLQGAAIAAHLAKGGERASNWHVVGIAVACLAALVAVAVGAAVVIALVEAAEGG